MERDFTIPAKIVELNPAHPLIHDLAAMASRGAQEATLQAIIEQLYDSALLAEGLLPSASGMLPRLQVLMEAAARGAVQTLPATADADKTQE